MYLVSGTMLDDATQCRKDIPSCWQQRIKVVHMKKCMLRIHGKEERVYLCYGMVLKKKAVRTEKSEERELRMAPRPAHAHGSDRALASDTYLRAFPRSTGNGKATCWPSPTDCVSHSAVWIILKSHV